MIDPGPLSLANPAKRELRSHPYSMAVIVVPAIRPAIPDAVALRQVDPCCKLSLLPSPQLVNSGYRLRHNTSLRQVSSASGIHEAASMTDLGRSDPVQGKKNWLPLIGGSRVRRCQQTQSGGNVRAPGSRTASSWHSEQPWRQTKVLPAASSDERPGLAAQERPCARRGVWGPNGPQKLSLTRRVAVEALRTDLEPYQLCMIALTLDARENVERLDS